MKLICPKCGKSQDVNKDDMMGRYTVCRHCRSAFMWEKNLKQHNQNKDKPNPV